MWYHGDAGTRGDTRGQGGGIRGYGCHWGQGGGTTGGHTGGGQGGDRVMAGGDVSPGTDPPGTSFPAHPGTTYGHPAGGGGDAHRMSPCHPMSPTPPPPGTSSVPPLLTRLTSFFSSSNSFSFCFRLPPPFSDVVAAGEYSRPSWGGEGGGHRGDTVGTAALRSHGAVPPRPSLPWAWMSPPAWASPWPPASSRGQDGSVGWRRGDGGVAGVMGGSAGLRGGHRGHGGHQGYGGSMG